MADPTQVLQQLTAQRAAAALMQTNMASPWSNFQTNLLNPTSKPKSQRLKLQTGPSPSGSSHNSRVNTPSLPSSPLRLNHREIEQTASTSRGSPGASPVDYSAPKPKRKSGLEQSALPGAPLPDPKPLPEPVYHPDSAAGQSLVQEAAFENLGLGMCMPGTGFGTVMTPYGPLPYELAARAGVAPGWPPAPFGSGFGNLPAAPISHPSIRANIPPSLWMSPSNPVGLAAKPQQSNLPVIPPTTTHRTPGTSPGTSITSKSTSTVLSSFTSGRVASSTSSVSPPSLGRPSPPTMAAKPRDPPAPSSNGRRSPSIVSDILAEDFFSTRPTAIGQSLNESGSTATSATRRPTVTFAMSPIGSPSVLGADSPAPSGADGDSVAGRGEDPLAAQVWKMYHKTKATLPHAHRMENLTWRMMAMALRKKRTEGDKSKDGVARERTMKLEELLKEETAKEPAKVPMGESEQEKETQQEDKDKTPEVKGEDEQQRGRRPDKGKARVVVQGFAAEEGQNGVEPEPDDAMDWRAVSRSRSRMSMDWRAGSRSRSRPPWETPATAPRLDANESHSHSLLGRRASDVGATAPIIEEAYASPSQNSTSVPIPIRPAAARGSSPPPPPPPAFHHSLGYMPHANFYGHHQGEAATRHEDAYFPRRVRKTSFDHTVTRPDFAAGLSVGGRHQYNGRPVAPGILSHSASMYGDVTPDIVRSLDEAVSGTSSYPSTPYSHAPPNIDNFFDLPGDANKGDERASSSPSHTLPSPGHGMGIHGLGSDRGFNDRAFNTNHGLALPNHGLSSSHGLASPNHVLSVAASAAVAESEARMNAVTMSIVNAGLDNVGPDGGP
ncbi:hypothetical protein FRC12_019289, partial [Ceratobasidium sp. 428]